MSAASTLAATGLLLCLAAVPAVAWEARVERGRALARTECARCDAVDRTGPSPLRQAPPFRTLHERYPVENLAEALTECIRTGHPTMPEFRFEPDQAEGLIAHLKALEL
ncbi:c-type cytochrome [Methylobacterium sp. 092160098-2]|jgi:mono/diheme cytochrome c family protein|uniref:c-type cytochrome n=1 Tax=Methylobacterium sp. 092160098-2 TaxID=3025129 RepID=UPI001DF84846|nr:cytochrome c [Methylobacterium sp. 092160098-2]MBY0253978.1 cytochrome c [Methylobacterium organophilum]MDE4914659.1 cytochrome c [Methylobacterium sp. 092160098-2]